VFTQWNYISILHAKQTNILYILHLFLYAQNNFRAYHITPHGIRPSITPYAIWFPEHNVTSISPTVFKVHRMMNFDFGVTRSMSQLPWNWRQVHRNKCSINQPTAVKFYMKDEQPCPIHDPYSLLLISGSKGQRSVSKWPLHWKLCFLEHNLSSIWPTLFKLQRMIATE
jgi:hypothetical protein